MMDQLLLNDKEVRSNLFPLTLTRSAADLRVGILTIREKHTDHKGKMGGFPGEENTTDQRG